MQIPGGPFDPTTVEPDKGFDPLPPGSYNVGILDTSIDLTNKQDGKMLKLTLQVIDGPHSGRQLFDRLLLEHPSPKAVEIARRKLSAICHAVGVMNLVDSSQLHGKTLTAKVKIQAAKGDYDASNDVKSYAAMAGSTTAVVPGTPSPVDPAAPSAPAATAPAPAAPAAAPAPGTAPWG